MMWKHDFSVLKLLQASNICFACSRMLGHEHRRKVAEPCQVQCFSFKGSECQAVLGPLQKPTNNLFLQNTLADYGLAILPSMVGPGEAVWPTKVYEAGQEVFRGPALRWGR